MCEVLTRSNFKQFKNPISIGDPAYIELSVTLNRLNWRLLALTELEDAGLTSTDRYKFLEEEVAGLFTWANCIVNAYWSKNDES